MNISWLFEIDTYKWSTKAVTFSAVDYTAKVFPDSFGGISMGWDISGGGLIYPSDLEFEVDNADDALARTDLEGEYCTIKLITDGSLTRTWKFEIRSAILSYGKIQVYCSGILQKYLDGDYPNTPHPRETWVSANVQPIDDDNRIPVIFGTAYIPLTYIYNDGDSTGYYVLGDDVVYTIDEVKSPPESGENIWTSAGYTFNQSSDSGYKLAEFVIAPPSPYTEGTWPSDQKPLVKYSVTSGSTVLPATILSTILQDFGVPAGDIDTGTTFVSAAATYVTQGIEWNGGYYEIQNRESVLSDLLIQCDSTLYVSDKIELHPFSKTSKETFTTAKTKKLSYNPSRITQSTSDSGHVSWAEDGYAQNNLVGKALVPVNATTAEPDSSTLECKFIGDSQVAQKLGILHFQRKLAVRDSISFSTTGSVMTTLATLKPSDVVTVNDTMLGGNQDIIISELKIKSDLTVTITGKSFSILQEFADLSPAAVAVAVDSTTPVLGNIDTVYISGSNVFKFLTGEVVPVTSPVTLTANLVGDTDTYDWEYWTGVAWANLSGTQDASTYSLAYDNAAWSTDILIIRCVFGDVFAQITITKIYDGDDGAAGADAGNWSSTLVLTSSDYRTVGWSAGNDETIIIDGTTYTITAGNTGLMSPATTYYIYLKPSVSTTVLQVTTTASDAVGANQILVGVAFPSVSPIFAQFQAFGGMGGVFIGADSIAAGSITADKIVANSLTSTQIDTTSITIGSWDGAGNLVDQDRSDLNYTDGADVTSANTAADTTLVSGIAAATIETGAANGTGIRNGTYDAYDTARVNAMASTTLISGGYIGTNLVEADSIKVGAIVAAKLDSAAISTCKFFCSDTNTSGYTNNRAYFTTASSYSCLGVRNTYAGASVREGIYSVTASTATTSSAIKGLCNAGSGVYGLASTGNGIKGQATSSGIGVNGSSGSTYGVYGDTATGTYGVGTGDKMYAAGGYVPFTGSHLGFSKQKMVTGDIACSEGSLLLSVSEGLPFLNVSNKIKDKAVIGIINIISETTNVTESNILGTLLTDERFFDEIIINEKITTAKKDNPDLGIKKGDELKTNDGIKYVLKSVSTKKIIDGHPDTLRGVVESNEYHVALINALGEGGVNVCSEGGDIEIGDYICSSSIPGKGMKQSDDLLHNYTVAKAIEKVIWANEPATIKMVGCTYHCG